MANASHVKTLLQGSRAWSHWRSSNERIIPQLSSAALTGAKLDGTDLRGANLRGANLSGASLVGAYLEGADLYKAKLVRTDCERADFFKANLSEAQLDEANLRIAKLAKVDFRGASLFKANLSAANLANADLSSVNLAYANIYRTYLGGTNFSYSSFQFTQLASLDLSPAIGLETVLHHAESSIDVDTLLLSQSCIPEVFLRGCGVPEAFITYIPSFTNKPIQFYSCFISYSHEDKYFARQLHDFLQGRGIRCWLDEHQLLPGHDIFEEVDRGIKLWDKVLLCASKNSLTSWWVDSEIHRAFKKEESIMEARGKKVWALIPLDLDGFLFEGWERGFAEQVKSRLAADFQGWESDNAKMRTQLEQVVKALRTDDGREEPPKSLL